MNEIRKYDVALSFAGEQRDYVEEVANELTSLNIFPFYDGFEEETIMLWGRHLSEVLNEVYEKNSSNVVMFISKEYIDKAWPTHERRSAISGAIQKGTPPLLVRFDCTTVPGLPTDINHLSAKKYTPPQLALMIAKKMGRDTVPEYRIHRVDEANFGKAKRLVYRIEVPTVYSESQGRMIATHIVESKHIKNDPVNALSFLFYFPVADPNGRADGSIDWAPNGKWADVTTVQTGKYSNFQFATQFWKERAIPDLYHETRVRMAIFREIVQSENRGWDEAEKAGGSLEETIGTRKDLITDYKRELAESHGLSEAGLRKIMVEGVVNNWPEI
ncbi:MAG: TIR domain-containing protein [Caldilineaceae bacterium SB0670_bin_27]|uniref:TIR domain-containing protein n=1 Tax=Caldilineaceae bacterium SB0664_bin_27 TaxID=2605260 RepID=A0A6B0YMQ6_9CHLR|nr:TIR domain-containing protein [Caldilineaceae bacterium SB0664_bin_27]MYJ79302.1 TIR domain-containing protein [Caldilineaceae bacterium SB0670_bin_27]